MKLNAEFRAETKKPDMSDTAKKLAGVNRSIAELFIKATKFGFINIIAKNGRKSAAPSLTVSYIGTYVRTMTELLQKAGMKSAAFERVE